jgi:hypothetical protein
VRINTWILALKTLNKLQFQKIRNIKTIIIDSTSITLDLKFSGKFLSKQMLLTKTIKEPFVSIGHYSGFKMTISMDQKTCKPLAILIHEGSPNDSKYLMKFYLSLKKRKILRKRQLILCDKGFYSAESWP